VCVCVWLCMCGCVCVVVCVCACVYRWHPQFTARTARCSFLPAQTQGTLSTHVTPRFRPPEMCVSAVFRLVLMPFWEFSTQLAPQQIKPPLPESAEIQECVCVCGSFRLLFPIKSAL